MSRNNGRRPRRGPAGPAQDVLEHDVIVSGDTGIFGGNLGGARDVAREGPSESGDLAAREFGVPQANLPGGVKHLVNAESHVTPTANKPPRPVDYHREHGVEPRDWGQYVTPPDESEHYPAERPIPLEHIHDAVPVYLEEHPQKRRVIRSSIAYNVNINGSAKEPSRICNRDPNRVEIALLNEDSTNDMRFSEKLAELQEDPAAGAGAGGGALLPHALNSYTRFASQEQLYGLGTSANSVRLSVIIVTEIPETAGVE